MALLLVYVLSIAAIAQQGIGSGFAESVGTKKVNDSTNATIGSGFAESIDGNESNTTKNNSINVTEKAVNATPATNFSDQIIESLRNYVANQETVIRESRLNNTKYYYDTNALETPTEKIFFKWCKKLGLVDEDF